MRKIKEVLRLQARGMSNRKIAVSCGIGRPAVAEYLRRAAQQKEPVDQLTRRT